MLVLAILAVVVVGVAAFFVGRSNGETRGEDNVRAEYEPGQPAYQDIYEAGQASGTASGEATGQQEGETTGKKAGKKVGLEQGEQQGEVTGANDVFDAYSSWEVGDYYVVEIGEGTGGVDYTLASRTQMQEGERYALCADDPSTVCSFAAPAQSGGSGSE
jgi:hypothetical protein